MIACSEKCTHQEDGICILKEVTKASDTPVNDCPYFKSRKKKEGK